MVRVLIFLALVLLAQPAFANGGGGMCANSFASAAAQLKAKFGEQPIARYSSPKGIVVIWGNPETLTWTITKSSAERTCVLDSGTGWQHFFPPGERS